MTLDGHALLAGLADGSLPPAAFGHAAHVHAAWQCLRDAANPEQGEARFRSLLRTYVARVGAAAKYHETVTVALLRLIEARRRAMPHADWPAFAAAHAELFAHARAVLATHYSAARLDSTEARATFVAPDLAALP
jgi:hypothetical protein